MAFTEETSSSSTSISAQTHEQMTSGVIQKRKAGRKRFKETRHPIYKGVRQRCGKWVCELRQPDHKKTRIWLGTYTCPHMAARAYDVAAFALKGESASLNFPHDVTASSLPDCNESSSTRITKDMQCGGEAFGDEDKEEEKKKGSSVYLDEEELFNMPELIDSMAEGLILTPPAMQKGFNWNDYDDLDNTADFSLWSYS